MPIRVKEFELHFYMDFFNQIQSSLKTGIALMDFNSYIVLHMEVSIETITYQWKVILANTSGDII